MGAKRALFGRIAALTLLLAPPAAAEGRSAAFEAVLQRLPATWLSAEPGWTITFTDLRAAARAADRVGAGETAADIPAPGVGAPLLRLAGASLLLQEVVMSGLDGGWPDLVGFEPTDLATLTTLGVPPELLLLTLDPAAAVEGLGPALQANGYAARDLGAWRGWGRGESDFAVDFAARDPRDPFGGALGRSSRVATDGEIIAHHPGWPLIMALAAGAPAALSARPEVARLLAALDDQRYGEAVLVQSFLLNAPWPARSPDGGLPPWSIGLLADLGTGPVDYALAILVYPDADTAAAAAPELLAAWQETGPAQGGGRTYAELAGGKAAAHVTGAAPAALVLTIARPMAETPETAQNRPYEILIRALMTRELDPLAVRD